MKFWKKFIEAMDLNPNEEEKPNKNKIKKANKIDGDFFKEFEKATIKEYKENNKIIKIKAELINNHLKIKQLDKREVSKKELESRRPLIAVMLLNYPPNEKGIISCSFYLNMGEPLKYFIRDKNGKDKEVSKQEFDKHKMEI